MSLRAAAFLTLLAVAGQPLAAQQTWLSEAAENRLAEQTAARIEAIRAVDDKAALAERMRTLVHALRVKIETWGEQGLLDRAPKFPRISIPRSRQKHLDAMARYQVCNWMGMIQQQKRYEDRARQNGAMASPGITLAVVYLRTPYAEQGGDLAKIEPFLTGTEMNQAFQLVMRDTTLISHMEAQCQPLITELFTFAK